MTVDRSSLEILLPVIEAAREELADMDADDVPSGVRKASKSSARRLPPPLARSVVNELTQNDAYRTAVADRYLTGAGVDDDLAAFLDRPTEALERINDRASQAEDAILQSELNSANQRIVHLESQLSEAKRRRSALVTKHDHDLDLARSSVSVGRERAEARIESMAARISEGDAKISALESELAALSTELASAEGRLVSSIQRARRKGEAGGQSGQRHPTDPTSSDPLELARWLDGVERMVRPFRERTVDVEAGAVVPPLQIEPGVAPDSESALASLIAQRPDRFLLDGYNIGGEIYADAFSTRTARDEVVLRAGRLARRTEAEVLVIFDGPDDEGRSGFRSSGGVTVRFSRGVKADDVIAALVASDPERTVVITNDRDLRDRCTVEGCIPIWSTAFIEWL